MGLRDWLLAPVAPQAVDRILDTDKVARCPDCKGTVAIGLSTLSTGVVRDGKALCVPVGDRYACQTCPCIYSVGTEGVFRQDPGSFPQTAASRHAPQPQREQEEKEVPPPRPLERPRI